jgi:hypothetical protein
VCETREVGDVLYPVLFQLLHLEPLTIEQVSAYRAQVILALKLVLQPVLAPCQPAEVLLDVEHLLTGVHPLSVTTPSEIILYYRLNHSFWSLSDNKEVSR